MLPVRLRTTALLLAIALLSLPLPVAAETFSGKVGGVTDGDTLSVMRDGKAVKVRVAGVDCPEKKQPFGTRAKQFTSDLAFGKVAAVEVLDVDRYGRIVGNVSLPGCENLNQEVVAAGLAWWYRQYARDDRTLASLEAQARSE